MGWVAPPGYTLRDGNGDLIEEFVLVFTSNTGNGRGGEYTSPATVTGSWAAQDGRHTSELLGRRRP